MGGDEFDLFGNPVRAGKGRRGRPAFEVTPRLRNKVKLLLALGWSSDRIGKAIEASVATLKRHFRAELKARDAMRDRLEADRLMAVYELAEKGNVGAHRQFDKMLARNDLMEIERQMGRGEKDKPEPAAEKPGKKEIASERAAKVDAELMAELDLEAGGRVRH